MSNTALIDSLASSGVPSVDDLEELLATYTPADRDHAASLAYRVARGRFGTSLYGWGVVDISNNCAKECFYCGLCRSNESLVRYRLTTDEVLQSCEQGHRLGLRTFLLEAGEDPDFSDDVVDDLIWQVRKRFPDSAICLALGEKDRDAYQRYFDAGADRYVLCHETADPEHFARLHPRRVRLANRVRCLEDLKDIGFETGTGMMVGTPFQTARHLAQDLAFLADFDPAVVWIGPFLPSQATPFADQPGGTIGKTLFVLSLVRLLLPDAGIPVLTSVATAHPRGREMAVMAGANIVMPNLTPAAVRGSYAPYDGKVMLGVEAVEGFEIMARRMAAIGYTLVPERGPVPRGH